MSSLARILCPALLTLTLALVAVPVSAQTGDGVQRGLTPSLSSGNGANGSILASHRDYALLIATGEYDHWPPLSNPVPDAIAVKQELETRFAFQTELLQNPTRAQVTVALRRYRQMQFGPGDQLLIFVAGHGDYNRETDDGYLAAKDSQLPTEDVDRTTLISQKYLRDFVDQIQVRHVLVVIDACFAGSFAGHSHSGGRGGIYEPQTLERLFTERDQYMTREYITSGGLKYVPDGEPGKHSPFVSNLLSALRDPAVRGRYLTTPDIESAVASAQSSPVWGTWGKHQEGGEFFLISRSADAHSPPPPPPARSLKSVCVVGLKNLSEDAAKDSLGELLTEQVSTRLAAGGRIRVISSQQVANMKRDLSLRSESSYSGATLQAIRENLGADLVVAGNYTAAKETGGALTASFTIQDVKTGETVNSVVVAGLDTGTEDIVQRATAALLAQLGVSDLTPEQLAEVKAGWPTKAESLKQYTAALAALHARRASDAIALLQQADAAESGVAFLHLALADAWEMLGYDKRAAAEAAMAKSFAAGLSKPRRLSIEARANELSGHWKEAVADYITLSRTEADNFEYKLELARAESYTGDGKDALVELASLAELPAPLGEDPRIPLALADAYDRLGDLANEARSAERARVAAAEKGSRLIEAEADIQLCWAGGNLGDKDGALRACEWAKDFYEKAGDKLGLARAQTNIGNVLAEQSKYGDALERYRLAAELTGEIGARGNRAGALLNMAKMQIYLDRTDDAKNSLRESIALAQEVGDIDTQGKALFYQADLAHTEGNLESAQQSIESAMQIAEQQSNRDGIARAYSFQATYSFQSGNLKSGLSGADKCIAVGTAAPSPSNVAYCQQSRGDILLAADRLDEARAAYHAAEESYRSMNQPLDAAGVWTSQAELDVEAGSAAEAERLAHAAYTELAKGTDLDMQALALCALLHAEAAQKKRDEAGLTWRVLEKLNRIDPDTQLEVALAEARYRALTGRYDLALDAADRARMSCRQRGRVDCELRARLLADLIRVEGGGRAQATPDLQAVAAVASQLGFAHIAKAAVESLSAN